MSKDWVGNAKSAFVQNGEFDGIGTAVAYCWFIWEKGYKGDTVVKWFN